MASNMACLSSQVSDDEKPNEKNLDQNKERSVYLVTVSRYSFAKIEVEA